MTWTQLLANQDVQSRRASKSEFDAMRALITRDLAEATIAALSADRRFATAYNAALQAATGDATLIHRRECVRSLGASMRECWGARPRPSFESLDAALLSSPDDCIFSLFRNRRRIINR